MNHLTHLIMNILIAQEGKEENFRDLTRATVKAGDTFCMRLFIYLVLLSKSRHLGKEKQWGAGEAKIDWNVLG